MDHSYDPNLSRNLSSSQSDQDFSQDCQELYSHKFISTDEPAPFSISFDLEEGQEEEVVLVEEEEEEEDVSAERRTDDHEQSEQVYNN